MEYTIMTTTTERQSLDKLISERMTEIDYLMNKGPSPDNEKALRDLQKSIQMIGRILWNAEEEAIVGNLWNFLEDEVYDRLEEIADDHNVSLTDIDEKEYDCKPWTLSAYYKGKTDGRW